MSRISCQGFHFTFLVFLLAIFSYSDSFCQKELEPIRREMDKLSIRIDDSLKTDLNLYNGMKGRLEDISKMREDALKSEALNQFQNEFQSQYAQAVKRAGVDMNAEIVDWSRMFPGFSFSIINNFSIKAVKKSAPPKPTHRDNPSGRASSFTTNINDFRPRQHVDCQLAGYSGVETEPMSIKAWTTAAVVGGCSSEGDLLNATKLSIEAKTITLTLSAKINVKGFALGVVGGAIFIGFGGISADFDFDNGITYEDQVSEELIAPALWFAQINETKNLTPSIDLSDYRGSTLKINMHADVYSISGLCCGTNGEANIKLNNATLVSSR